MPSETAGFVSVVDVAKRQAVSKIQMPKIEGSESPARPMGGVLSPDGSQVFMSLGRAGAVAVIDVASRKLVRTINGVGARPWGVALSADGSKLYTANGPSGDVSIIDVATGKVEKKVSTGGSPCGVVIA